MTATSGAPARLAVLGDDLACLSGLNEVGPGPGSHGGRAHPAVCTLVLAVDAAAVRTRWALRRLLRRKASAFLDVSRLPAGVTHIVVVLAHSPLAEERTLSVARGFGQRVHEQLAQSWGVDVGVTVVLVADDPDPELLARRIEELVGRPSALDPAVAVSFDELTARTIPEASASDYT